MTGGNVRVQGSCGEPLTVVDDRPTCLLGDVGNVRVIGPIAIFRRRQAVGIAARVPNKGGVGVAVGYHPPVGVIDGRRSHDIFKAEKVALGVVYTLVLQNHGERRRLTIFTSTL